jgi:hypothetical protein
MIASCFNFFGRRYFFKLVPSKQFIHLAVEITRALLWDYLPGFTFHQQITQAIKKYKNILMNYS